MSARTGSLTRRDLVKGGALIVGFSLFGRWSSPGAAVPPKQPWSVSPAQIDSWLVVHADSTVTLHVGKVELGQGTLTGLLQIAAEELDLDLSQVGSAEVDTSRSPDQGSTARSAGIEEGGMEVRIAAAEARQALLQRAAARLNASFDDLVVNRGVVSVAGSATRAVSYGELLDEGTFNVSITGKALPKRVDQYKLVGTRAPRVDIPAKVAGTFEYMQFVKLPGMQHGRVVRPDGQGAYGTYFRVQSIDEQSIADIPGVTVVRRADFVGVVAPVEWHAVKAARQLKVTWAETSTLPGNGGLHARMRAAVTTDTVIEARGDPESALAQAAHRVAASYSAPYQSHAPFGPNCAIADVQPDAALVICSTHHPFDTPAIVGKVIGLPAEKVRVRYVEGSGTYGRSGFDDAAQAAAVMSQQTGKPVRVQFTRGDEVAWDAYGPAHVADVRVAADAVGKLIAYDYVGWQHGWMYLEPTEEHVLGIRPPVPGSNRASNVNRFNAGAMYEVANKRLFNRHLSGLDGFLRGSALRSPMDLAISFASEQAIDELAIKVGMDPVAFRRHNITHPRWLGVLDAVTGSSQWQPNATRRRNGSIVSGRGVGLGTHFVSYGAAVADVDVHLDTGNVTVRHIHAALDCGLAINPGLVENQIIGMCMQATSRALKEEVLFDERQVLSRDWASYEVLRFADHPQVTPIVVQQLGEPSTGAGEEAMGATNAAIANAFFHATGVRMRTFPLTPARVLAALKAPANPVSVV